MPKIVVVVYGGVVTDILGMNFDDAYIVDFDNLKEAESLKDFPHIDWAEVDCTYSDMDELESEIRFYKERFARKIRKENHE